MATKEDLFRITRAGYLSKEEMEGAYTYSEIYMKLTPLGFNIGLVMVMSGDRPGKSKIEDEDTGKIIAHRIIND